MKPVRTLQDCEDLFERRLVEDVHQRGFRVVHQPEYCYTVGLWHRFRHPELILFALPAERGQFLMERAAEQIQMGEFSPETLAEGYRLQSLPVHPSYHREFLAYNRWFYRGDQFQAVQLIWPDADHYFPNQPEFRRRLQDLQPLLQ